MLMSVFRTDGVFVLYSHSICEVVKQARVGEREQARAPSDDHMRTGRKD
jgi:hypothetical protein